MTIIHYIGIAIGVVILFFVLMKLTQQFHIKWQSGKYPDKDRVLSKTEARYLENAKLSLSQFAADQKHPKYKYTFYSFSFLPLMFLSWGALWAVGQYFARFFAEANNSLVSSGDAIFIHADPIGPSAVIAVFTGIFMAAWLSYFLFQKHKKFVTWMMLTQSSSKGEQPASVASRRIAEIEPKLRRHQLDALSAFSPVDFLASIYHHHQKLCGIGAMVLLVPTFIFFFFDVRDKKIYAADAVTTYAYWNGHKTVIPYDDLTNITLICSTGSKNSLNVRIFLNKGDKTIDRIDLIDNRAPETLKKLQKLDEIWRSQGILFQKSILQRKGKAPKPRYRQKCFARLSNYSQDQQTYMRRILHADEFRPD